MKLCRLLQNLIFNGFDFTEHLPQQSLMVENRFFNIFLQGHLTQELVFINAEQLPDAGQ